MMDEAIREIPLRKETVFQGVLIDVAHWQVRLPDGREALREIALHAGAAAVVPVDDRGQVTLVRQHRVALDLQSLEIPAGKFDSPTEDPLLCARRELREETGLEAAQWRFLTRMDPSPGFLTEQVSIYLATGLSQEESALDEDEFLRVERLQLGEALARVMRAEITDAKTVIGLLMAGQVLGVNPPSNT